MPQRNWWQSTRRRVPMSHVFSSKINPSTIEMNQAGPQMFRHLKGKAYIVFGPGPIDSASVSDLGQPQSQFHSQEHSQAHEKNHCRDHQQNRDHHHHDHEYKPSEQPHFWAVFRPEEDSLISPKDTIGFAEHDTQESTVFFLSGTPHVWGSYPPDMPEPHGCIPPHLYYKVTLSELCPSPLPCHSSTSADPQERGESNDQPKKEHLIPFVHRFGDGKDDAGGLTTAYSLLEEREDADDFGVFVDEIVRRFQDASLSSGAKDGGKIELDLAERLAPKADEYPTVALYACTEVLFSETRTKLLIEDQFFSAIVSDEPRRDVLHRFKRHFYQILESSTSAMPFYLLYSDLRVILPVDDLR